MYREEQLKALLEGRRILIAGYGREGQSAERLVRRLLPEAPLTIATQVADGRWMDAAGRWHDDWPFDLVVKSPGIPTFHCCPSSPRGLGDVPCCSPSQGELSEGLRGNPCCSPSQGELSEGLRGNPCCSPSQGELSEGLRGCASQRELSEGLRGNPCCSPSQGELSEGLRGSPSFQLTSLTDLFLQVYGDLTVGVTGTKGKSTTASLIHHLLPGSILAGNIGVPLFDILDEVQEGARVVAELSCHQLENIHRGPHIGVLLNLYEEHLDHYENYMGYKMAKMQIALRQGEGDHFFYCTDNEELCELVKSYELRVKSELHPYAVNNISDEERTLLEACPLAGDHNRSNALVACRVAQLVARQPLFAFHSPLSTFQGLRHRMERVGEVRGITWYDDSISTIPAAAIAAVQALGRVDTLILGGFDRGIDYGPLVDFLREHPISNLVFVGQAGRRILQMLSTTHYPLSTHIVEDDYTKIVPWCADHTPQGGVVLLSPAAASYDAFKNFEHRGDFFREQVELL